jgi:hypothetical protein
VLRRLIPIAALALVLTACTSSGPAETGTAAAASKVAQLQSVPELKDRFNADVGKIRLILLISPT